VAAERGHRLGLAPRQRVRPAGGALGQPAEHEPPQRRGQASEDVERDRGATAGGGQCLGGGDVERLGLLAKLARRLGDRELGVRAQLPERREHLVPHACPRESGVGVRRVLAPVQGAGAQVLAHLLARHLEQRPHEPPAPGLHPQQRAASGRDREPVEHRLGLVARGVGGCEVPGGGGRGERVARIPRLCLEVAGPRQLHALDRERDAEPVAQAPAQLLVAAGRGAQAVVHVQRRDLGPDPHGHVEQAHRVAPAGEQH
jgi:hypothetical protein